MYNFLTFDIEDWFHILDIPESASGMDWDSLPSRVEFGLDRILALLSSHGVTGTFFVLGWMAEKKPEIVHRIYSAGHEIASHGYTHELIHNLGPEKFREDIRHAKIFLEDLIGTDVKGFRGPGFSISPGNVWAFDIISEEGFHYDSTLFPGKHGHGGISGLSPFPFNLITRGGRQIEEYPISAGPVSRHAGQRSQLRKQRSLQESN